MLLQTVQSILKGYGYDFYSRPFELNILGLRNNSVQSNRFDDQIHVFYNDPKKGWQYHIFPATTDPGTYWLKNPMQKQGTAILAQGQYKQAYALGLHRGQYKALVQAKPITVLRDYDRNGTLDFNSGKKDTGRFGVNIHRANRVGKTKQIDKYSAGCQVFENATDFDSFMALCEQHRKLYGNTFSYTLIDFRAWQGQAKKQMAYVGVLAGLIGLTAIAYFGFIYKEKLFTL